ncbi:MAG: carboxypeptidase-like regulatory domain-containing protein, partial [Bacteroidota bacterium]
MKYFLILIICFSFSAYSQNGTIRGTVYEEATGESLIGVTAVISGTTTGAVTDFDGKFSISVAPGTYDLQVSFVSFQTLTINGVVVKAGEVTLIDQIYLQEEVSELTEVVVTAEVIRTTDAALLTVKRKSANLIDGISATSFRKIGDNNAATAAKRITGVSIEGGKYVYVRGLGDRYTKTLLNGMDVPGLDPDRNTIQMDIFPTNVLDNIIVSKSFTADLPADFTGGLVNIDTKDVPDIKETTFQGSFGFNPSMHLNPNYLSYEGGSTDFLGFDDGTREIPVSDNSLFQDPSFAGAPGSASYNTYEAQLQGFGSQLGATEQRNFMNFNLGFSTGNQKSLSLGTLGYNFALTYQNNTEFFDDALYARYLVQPNQPELGLIERVDGSFGRNNVLLGGLLGFALKTESAKYRVNVLRLQNGESTAGFFNSSTTELIGTDLEAATQSNLEYSQRAMTNLLLSGEHFEDEWNFSWKLSPTLSRIYDPDVRFTKYEILPNSGNFDIGTGNSGLPQRIWRELDEINLAGRVDAEREYLFIGKEANFKFGAGTTFKQRDFIIREFNLAVNQQDFDGSFDELMADENLWPNENGNFHRPLYIGGNVNQYDASSINYSFYVSNDFLIGSRLKSIIGLRAEAYSQL